MKSKPDTTILGTTDLVDQPKGNYIFLVENLLGPRQAFYVDRIRLEGDTVIGEKYVAGDDFLTVSAYETVIQIPLRSIWGLIKTDYTYTHTYREALEHRKASNDAETKMAEEIFGKGEVTVTTDPSTSGTIRVPTTGIGQYL